MVKQVYKTSVSRCLNETCYCTHLILQSVSPLLLLKGKSKYLCNVLIGPFLKSFCILYIEVPEEDMSTTICRSLFHLSDGLLLSGLCKNLIVSNFSLETKVIMAF